MAKRYFFTKRKENTSIVRIVVALVVVLGAILVLFLALQGLRSCLGGYSQEAALEQYEKAHALYAAGDLDGAQETLSTVLLRGKDPILLPRALLLQAAIDRVAGRSAEMLASLKRAVIEYPSSPDYPVAATLYANALEASGQTEAAVALYEVIRETAPPEFRASATSGMARNALRTKNLLEARKLFREALNDAEWGSPAWNEALNAVGNLNVRLIFSPAETVESKYYTIEKGDNLTNIGIKLNTTQGLLTRANGVNENTQLRIGQQIKYTPKDFRIIIERSTCRLFLLDKDGIFKRYHVGLGMPGHETALGKYTIGNKQKDPTWFKPGAGPVPAGDPANELGTRWMPLTPSDAGLPGDLGIHGTIAPETIGQYKSHGCPRMLKEDVEELYDLVVRSTPVEIVERMDPVNIAS
ncbi:MAG TPA: L,D-transpeptidase family protein [Candidatus Hydrogenedentes bacterium]|nr:L,D-transpeptidase family protein [Candidatus Hydrogenedentota bacterium]